MINGKFFTGLPPKMVNRSNSITKNRQESHFFWPDDTSTESAVETRVRRRASLSMSPGEKPIVEQRTSTSTSNCGMDLQTPTEMDAKKLLHNQFAKSSIQFFDNICEEEEPRAMQQRHKSYLKSGRQEITLKPTATKLELPQTETDTAAIKKKTVYDSKVLFYDYADEENLNNRKDLRKVKIDMNDKKEVERNTKNSPKLQIKRNMQNYIKDDYSNNEYEKEPSTTVNRYAQHSDDDDDMPKVATRQSRVKTVEGKQRNNIYRRDQTPKRILKPSARNFADYSHYPECRDEDFHNEDSDYIEETMRHVQINGRRPAAKKHVTYSEEEEEIPVRNYQHDDHEDNLYYCKESNPAKYRNANVSNAHSTNRYNKVTTTTTNAGSNRRQQQQRTRPQQISIDDCVQHVDLDKYQYMATNQKQNQLNNNNNSNSIRNNNQNKTVAAGKYNNNNNNNSSQQKLNNEINNDSTETLAKMSAQKHLRSNLCFHDGEIVASDNESAATTTQRNARSTATKRVSVGLPA